MRTSIKISRVLKVFLGSLISLASYAQTATTFSGGGNWSTGTWSNGVANTTSFNPTIAANVSVDVTFAGIGNLTLNASRTLTIPSGQTLTIGASGLPKNFSAGGSSTIDVFGTLIIWGNFTSGGSIQFTVRNGGKVVVHGNATFASGDNTDVKNGASFTVSGLTTGAGQLQGVGNFYANGGCTPPASGFCTSGTLPIKIILFEGDVTQSSILLKWSTASELNFDYFNLQKSSDGLDFKSIANIKGNGTTNERHDYSFEDEFPLIGKNYYRLTSVDFNNYRETFKVIVQEYSGEKNFQVSPNPTDGQTITLNYNFDSKDGHVVIYDSMGLMVDSFQVNETGLVSFTNPLKDGIYFAKYWSPSFNKVIRFLVKK